ncbi:flagellar biosynthesis protein FlhB [Limimaricola pyoseonensis]|uniref:Flagellar biosynthetic protein FlhB n=1 Tax=Limimaricola pyoseonensis TaxID=521013 RepID=A0A1G7KCN7_9RHOB|nr:flagellar biosynthesis protein FlhB [Limimaricola pyoseonensis]SDF34993.1 flagellar biosynthetic protein FlhB [Limimaricola pyoseonensis]
MSEEDKSSKTEQPTEAKLRKARQKGDVPSSKETGNMMSAFALLTVTLFVLPPLLPSLAGELRGLLGAAGQIEIGNGASGLNDVSAVARRLALSVAGTLAPVVLVMVLAAVFGVLISGPVVVAGERIKPKLEKLSPLKGLKRLFSADALVEFAKNVAKVAVIALIAGFAVREAVTGIWQAPLFTPETLLPHARNAVVRILIGTVSFLAVVALVDVLWKRADYTRKQKMSLKEVRDEHKESEGDPFIKSKRREIARQRAKQRIAISVPTATVVLTNPTHYAVALRYTPGVDSAPVCVAKGADLVAAQIRKLAAEHEVPMVENRPLARTLYAAVEVDEAIPVEHWQAVAEIIGWVMDLRRRTKRKPPEGSRLRPEE